MRLSGRGGVRLGTVVLAWLLLVSVVVFGPVGAPPASAQLLVSAFADDGDVCVGVDDAGDAVDGVVLVREFDGEWFGRSNDDDIIEAWGELYPDDVLPAATPDGYRYDVAVCVGAGGVIVGIDFEGLDLVAADDAQGWFNNALSGAADGLDLKAPGWVSFPDRAHNQIVYLDTWFYVQEFWVPVSASSENGEVRVTVTATPIGVDFRLIPQADGQAEIEFSPCVGRGEVWTPGNSGPSSCSAPPWEHSTSILGAVEVRGQMEYQVVVTQTTLDDDDANSRGGVTTTTSVDNRMGPWDTDDDTPGGSRYEMQVAEVQTYGLTGDAVAVTPGDPVGSTPGGDTIGVTCRAWDLYCSVVKPIGGVLVDFFVPQALIDALEACGDAFSDAFSGFGDLLSMLNPANWDDIWSDFNDLKDTLTEAKDEGRLISVLTDLAIEAGEDALQLDRLRDADGNWDLSAANVTSWVSYMACDALIGFVTGAAVDKIADFAQVARRWKDKRDRGDDNGPSDTDINGSTCAINPNSFPGYTLILLADGSYKRIDEISQGDSVLSFDVESAQWTSELVLDQWSHPDDGALTTVSFADGSGFTATDDHLVWSQSQLGWRPLHSFVAGDALLSPGGTIVIDQIDTSAAVSSIVWDISVANTHTFTVNTGTHDVLVHNRPCPSPSSHQHGSSDGGDGEWGPGKNTGDKGVEYQEQITGAPPGTEYLVEGPAGNTVAFDGYDSNRNVLLDAKEWDNYPPLDTTFWQSGTLDEATRQLAAAGTTPVEWVFSTQEAADAVADLFAANGIVIDIVVEGASY